MAWMTLSDAVNAFEFYDLFDEIVDSYGEELEEKAAITSELYDLIEEHEDEYEFLPDLNGNYSESFERNLKEALTTLMEEQGLGHGRIHLIQEDYLEEAMDDEDIESIYHNKIDPSEKEDETGSDEFDEYDEEENYY